ncbi:DUF3817 domain-containing protein [Kocuria palustris]|uniref:DUF3817 domain-containing protein n=1 Tax=Kocuria palustris TaxID=71999 RepID=UPI0028D7966E|nr:DUF3817 domain-containing protein [Kocuria palustris]
MSSDPNLRTTGPSTGPTTAPAAPAPHADPVTPHRLFRVLALAEAVTWTLLILGMIGKYALHLGDWPVSVGGGIHGFVFLSYCAVVVIVWIDARWSVTDGLLALLSAVIPYATIPVERRALRRGLLPHRWRLRGGNDGDEPARGPLEKLLAALLRHPVVSTVVVVIVVVALYLTLLAMGPPVEVSPE